MKKILKNQACIEGLILLFLVLFLLCCQPLFNRGESFLECLDFLPHLFGAVGWRGYRATDRRIRRCCALCLRLRPQLMKQGHEQ